MLNEAGGWKGASQDWNVLCMHDHIAAVLLSTVAVAFENCGEIVIHLAEASTCRPRYSKNVVISSLRALVGLAASDIVLS